MSVILSRLHLGVMGSAFQRATYGWFGWSRFGPIVMAFAMRIKRAAAFSVRI